MNDLQMVLDDDEPGMASEDDTKLDEANSQVCLLVLRLRVVKVLCIPP